MGHPVRYSIMALLAAADRAEFGFVRDHVEVSDSVLSKQMSALEDAAYVKVHKGYVENRPRSWLSSGPIWGSGCGPRSARPWCCPLGW